MAMRRERMRLGDLLIKQDVLTEENLKKALELQKGTGKKSVKFWLRMDLLRKK